MRRGLQNSKVVAAAVLALAAILLTTLLWGDRDSLEPRPTNSASAPPPGKARSLVTDVQGAAPSATPMRTSLPPEPSLVGLDGATSQPAAPVQIADPTPHPRLPDQRLLKVYRVLEKGAARVKEGKSNDWFPVAMLKLMQEQRFFYLGPPEQCPSYKETPEIKYVSTTSQGLKVVFALHRSEFPEAFREAPQASDHARPR